MGKKSLGQRYNEYEEKKNRAKESVNKDQAQGPYTENLSTTETAVISPTGESVSPEPIGLGASAPASVIAPAGDFSITETNTPSPLDKVSVQNPATSETAVQEKEVPDFVKAGSYEEFVKTNPDISRGQYAYDMAKYRREQGLPDMTYPEWVNIIKNQDPFETEAERQKREKRMKRAYILNGVGSILGNLVNYVRARNGNVAMKLDDGSQGYNRLDRLRQGREQLARSNAKDYLGAIQLDRAERAKEEQQKILREQQKKAMEMDMMRLQVAIDNAKSDSERRKFEQDLATKKFEYQQQLDKEKLAEQRRHNQAQESISRDRAENGGGNDGIGSTATAEDGTFMTRKKPLSKEEAFQIVSGTRDSEGYHEMFRTKTVTTNENGQTVRTGDVDWVKLAGWLIAQKKVPKSVLKNMGYKGDKSEKQRDYSEYMEDDFSDLKE